MGLSTAAARLRWFGSILGAHPTYVPKFPPEQLHETHPLFHQFPGEQTIASKMSTNGIIKPVKLAGGIGFPR